MNDYKLSASVRITHPVLSAVDICNQLKIQPDTTRTIGDARVSPSGKPLTGTWNESYVAFEFSVFPEDSLVTLLERELKLIIDKKEILSHIVETGGLARCYVLATPNESTFGEEIPPKILRALVDLSLSLCLEIYCDS